MFCGSASKIKKTTKQKVETIPHQLHAHHRVFPTRICHIQTYHKHTPETSHTVHMPTQHTCTHSQISKILPNKHTNTHPKYHIHHKYHTHTQLPSITPHTNNILYTTQTHTPHHPLPTYIIHVPHIHNAHIETGQLPTLHTFLTHIHMKNTYHTYLMHMLHFPHCTHIYHPQPTHIHTHT